MPIAHPIQVSFSGGEVSPRLYARVDTSKYQSGAETIENFIVIPHGGLKKRTGFKFVHPCRQNNASVRLIPFQYNAEQAYVLEFGNNYIRFFTNGGILISTQVHDIFAISKANPAFVDCTLGGAANTFVNGDRVIISGAGGMFEVNGREFTVTGRTIAGIGLSGVDSTGYTTYTSGGTVTAIVEVTTTYTTAQLAALTFAQSADTLYIAHPSHPLRQLVRNSATSWTLSDCNILRGPWRTLNKDETKTIKSNALTGSATITASAATFNTLHIGAKYKLYMPQRGASNTEWGSNTTDTATLNDVWAYNGNSYRVTLITGAGVTTNRYQPPVHVSGTVRLFISGQVTNSADLLFLHKGYGIVTMTGYTSTTIMTGTVYSGFGYTELPGQLVDTDTRYIAPTSFWQEGAWSDYRGYPETISFFEQRLMAAKTQTIWGSVSGNYTDFEEGVQDDSALNYTIASEQVDVIRWINPGKQLLIGTTGGEYVVGATSLSEPVTPTNIRVSRESSFGSSKCMPVKVGNAVLYMQRRGDPDNAGTKMREMAYSFETDGYVSNDLTIWSDHVTGDGVTELAYQADPHSLVWGVRADGQLTCLTYDRPQEVTAWHRHIMGGYSNAGHTADAVVENVCGIPGTDQDEIWCIVKRYIDGGTVRYVETMSYFDDSTAQADGIFVDSAITYSGASTATITGLWHLRGETVKVLGNGIVLTPAAAVSATGVLVLPSAVTKAQIGFGYTAKVQTLDIEAGAASGTAQGQSKRITKATLRLNRSLGGYAGADSTRKDLVQYRHASPTTLYTGDIEIPLQASWGKNNAFYYEQSDPLPVNIAGVIFEVNTTG